MSAGMSVISLRICSIFAVLVACSHHVNGVSQYGFYPFVGFPTDHLLPPNNDGSSGPIRLPRPFPFFNENYRTIYVSCGLVTGLH